MKETKGIYRRGHISSAYVDLASKDESAIVVSQIWAEIDEPNSRIRRSLRERGLLVGAEEKVTSLRRVDLTTAQKSDPCYYPEDHVVVRRKRGGFGRVCGITKRGVIIDTGHSLHVVKSPQLDAINVCRPLALTVCRGDRLQLKANALTASGAKLADGEIVTVSPSVSAALG